ncbi:PREDICTED: restin homolog isoform X3 [Bactrocera latifrons]|uniref:restin homolog isoform X3 n=2 Tax=Bactrocera latifrons TaxID=174628 RepID=UPI0008DD1EDC|nr:PREDICTED: restin homolog isoform X3 [Bactrocera latifrons]
MSDDKSNCEMPPPMSSSSEIAPPTDGDTLLLSNGQSIPNATHSPVEPASSAPSTPTLSITGGPTSRLRAPTNYSSDIAVSVSKIGRLCSHAAPKTGPPPRDTKSMSRESDGNLSSINSAYTVELYLEATGRRRSSDHGAVLTQDTEQFIIGQKVWVGGIRPGQIAYIGETHFAPGDWAGIVLDEPNGKNDGCVAGKRYFQCEPRRGIFSRLTRLTLAPLSGANTPTSPLAKMSPERSRTVSPTASIRSSFLRSPGKNGLAVGDRIIVSSGFGSRPGILRYLGETQFASGNWCGVELDEPSGKNDGSVDGIKYFECKPKYGVFVPIAKVSLSPSSKKSRLSRTGSRESLNSIGTINSIATTNTSRLRMNAQRKSLSIKPVVAAPKSQYSMQDLLHEKQKHIEQLMIERELDREDCQNQALQYQKNINELKSRIMQLERSLDDERKKSEDLQFSIDEATYCGNDVQSHLYREKIQELEKKLTDLSTETGSAKDTSTAINAPTKTSIAENAKIILQLQQQKEEYEARLVNAEDEQKRLQENIVYLQKENEGLQKELLHKDESLEKFSLSACGIQNLGHELDLLKEEAEKERQQLQTDFALKLEEKDMLLNTLRSELTAQKNALSTVEIERSNNQDEYEILQTECKNRESQLQDVNEQLVKLKSELSMQKAENVTLEELVKVQQDKLLQEKRQMSENLQEIEKLKNEIISLRNTKDSVEIELRTANEDLKKLTESQKTLEEQLSAATSADQENLDAITQLDIVIEDMNKKINDAAVENDRLNAELRKEQELKIIAAVTEAELRKLLKDQQQEYTEILEELKKSNTTLTESRESDQRKLQECLDEKMKKIEALNIEVGQLKQGLKQLESNSSMTEQELNSKIEEFKLKEQTFLEDLRTKENALKSQTEACAYHDRVIAEKIECLNTTMSALDTANNDLNKQKQELALTLIKCSDLNIANKTQGEQCAQQQLEIGNLTRKLDSLNTKCESLKTQNGTLESELNSSRSIICQLEDEISKLKDKLAMHQKNLLETEERNNDERLKLESQIEEIIQKFTNVSKYLEEERAITEQTRNELSKKKDQLTVLEEKSIKLELTLSDEKRQQEILRSKYESMVEQNKTLENDLNTLRTSSTDSNTELLKMSQMVTLKQKAYDELLDKTNMERVSLEGQLEASQQRLDILCSQVEMLTQEMKSATEENIKRVEILKLEQEKYGKQELELSELSRKFEALSAKYTRIDNENQNLQRDLATLRNTSTTSDALVTKLTEELTQNQKTMQDLTDKSTADRLQLSNQLQELEQRLEAKLRETDLLRSELQEAIKSKDKQAEEFELLKFEIQAQSTCQLDILKEKESTEQKKIIENFQAQLKDAEQSKAKLDEAISSLQQQIKLLQDELLKSQLDFKAKEDELSKKIINLCNEGEEVREVLRQTKLDGSNSLSTLELEKLELHKTIESLQSELKSIEDELRKSRSEIEQLKKAESSDAKEFQNQIESLKSALDVANTEAQFRTKMAEEDKNKIEELRKMVDTVQTVNTNISATNAEMSHALQSLEQEKCETAHIFELFEMESDQNMEKLGDKLVDLKQKLIDAQAHIEQKSAIIKEKESEVSSISIKFEASQTALVGLQSTLLDQSTKISELSTANTELEKLVFEKKYLLEQQAALQSQLDEYKQVVNEMDNGSAAKNEALHQLQERVKELEEENLRNMEFQERLNSDNVKIQRKFEILDLEKTREMVAAQSRINELQALKVLKPNNSATADVPKEGEEPEGNLAQINFLNSIIADMQKKNDSLKAKIEALEALPTDFTQPKAFELIAKRKPAPRVFCDICDEFDKHETEDCPLQASDDRDYSPPPLTEATERKVRKLPEPRKYCETCEVFGHLTGECAEDEW